MPGFYREGGRRGRKDERKAGSLGSGGRSSPLLRSWALRFLGFAVLGCAARDVIEAAGTTSLRCGVPCSISIFPYDDSDSRMLYVVAAVWSIFGRHGFTDCSREVPMLLCVLDAQRRTLALHACVMSYFIQYAIGSTVPGRNRSSLVMP